MTAIDDNGNNTELSAKRRRKLAAGVLKQAARDLRRYRSARSRSGQELYLDAYRWVTSDEFSWPFSFFSVCHALNLAPENVRAELMNDLALSGFSYWTRRCERATRRLSLSLNRVFVSEPDVEAATTALSGHQSRTLQYEGVN